MRSLVSQLFTVPLLPLLAAGAAGQTRAPAYPALVRPVIQTATFSESAGHGGISFGPQAEAHLTGTCVLAELAFGTGGLVLGAAGTDFLTGHTGLAGLALIAGGVGTTTGIMLGSDAGRCRASAWGAAVGAAVGVLVGVTAGKAFATDRTEAEDFYLGGAYLIMIPLAWLGAQL